MLPKELRKIASRKYTLRCPSGKRRYTSYDSAYWNMLEIQSKLDAQGGGTFKSIYRCEKCYGWHLSRREAS